jgi:hypothetical protein
VTSSATAKTQKIFEILNKFIYIFALIASFGFQGEIQMGTRDSDEYRRAVFEGAEKKKRNSKTSDAKAKLSL